MTIDDIKGFDCFGRVADSGAEEDYRRAEGRYARGVRFSQYRWRLANFRYRAEVAEDCRSASDR